MSAQANPGQPARALPAQDAPPAAPSPIWFGAVVSLSLLACVVWLLSYALLDLGWQQRLGGWNYVITVAFSTVMGQLLQHWHGDPRRDW